MGDTDFTCPNCEKDFETAVQLDTHLNAFHYSSLAEAIDTGEFVFIDNERVGHEHYHCVRCGESYPDQETAKGCCKTTGAIECSELGCMIEMEDLL